MTAPIATPAGGQNSDGVEDPDMCWHTSGLPQKEIPSAEPQQGGESYYSDKSDMDVAKHINLALLLHNGISDQDAGFDTVTSINDAGLAKIASIIKGVREAAISTAHRAGMEEAAGIAEACVEQRCCGQMQHVVTDMDMRTGEAIGGQDVCCGNPEIVPKYPHEIAAAIRQRLQET